MATLIALDCFPFALTVPFTNTNNHEYSTSAHDDAITLLNQT